MNTSATQSGSIFFTRLQTLVHGQAELFSLMSSGAPLSAILEGIIHWAEEQSDGKMKASLLLLDPGGTQLLHGAAPSLPQPYNEAIHGLTIGYGVGSCGTAAFLKEAVIVSDITVDPLWKDFKELATGHGLYACWSVPLINKTGKVLGTFAVYYTEPKAPGEDDLQIINLISRTAIIAIEYHLAQEEKERIQALDRQLSEKMKAERQQFYDLLMTSPAMIAVLSGPEHTFRLANSLYCQAVGAGRTIIGKSIRQALPEIVGQGFIEILDEVYKTGKPYLGNEVPILLDRAGTGQLENRYFNFVYQVVRDDHQQVEGIFVHAVDVTEQVRARKEAEASEERFRSFVMEAPMPIAIYTGREMKVQMVNDALLEAWGKDRSVVGKTFREALPELEGQPFYQLLDDVYTTGIPYQATEDRVELVRNGKRQTTYYNFSYKALRNSEGEIYGIINTAAEVTELVRAKLKLAETQEDLANAIELAELGTWSIDLGNNKVSFSQRVALWFDVSPNGSDVRSMLNAIKKEDRASVLNAVNHALKTNDLFEAEYRVDDPSGNTRILHALGRLHTDENGNLTRLNGIVQDMTMQRLNEQELEKQVQARTIALKKANLELMNMNDSLQQFVYIASHDLQEPLRKINMFSDLLKGRHLHHLDTQAIQYIDKISFAAQIMSRLINDLLDYSRTNSKEVSFTKVNLNEIIHNVVGDYEIAIREKQAELHINCDLTIEAVSLQMNQLFYNLIGNALKFARAEVKPQIDIRCRMLETGEVQRYERLNSRVPHCEIMVRDNGIGFEQQFAEQIFVIFQRLHGKHEYHGTGIGLAICKKIVDNHDGVIFAQSEQGKGASFHVLLPVRRH